MKAMLLKDDEDFSTTVYGWKLTTPPPSITAAGGFQPVPTDLVDIQTSNSQIVPAQTITPLESKGANLSVISDPSPNKIEYWYLDANRIKLELKMVLPADVTFEMTIAAVSIPGGGLYNAEHSIEVNGTSLASNISDTNPHWHPVSYQINGNSLKQGVNEIIISCADVAVLMIGQITVSTVNAVINAKYFWKQICAAIVQPADTYSHSTSYEQGNTSSETTTNTFAESVGVTIKIGGIESLLTGLSVQLSASFSATQSTSHAVSISKSTTETTKVIVTCLTGYKSNTFQVWQLCLQYEANGNSLVQALGADLAPIIYKQYMEPS